MSLTENAVEILKNTSRTFFIPIMRLPGPLRSAVGSAYLCFRAIDEAEDHAELPAQDKIHLLTQMAAILRRGSEEAQIEKVALQALFAPYGKALPTVTRRLHPYAHMAPEPVQRMIWTSTATMADRMAHWVEVDWTIRTESDLDEYTYDVAGSVGLLLTELWAWHDGTKASHDDAVGFGRSLQAVNIARNRDEDRQRGVDFFPDGWTFDMMIQYIRRQFDSADSYMQALANGPARDFCQIPLTLAKATVESLQSGQAKLTREEVVSLVQQCTEGSAS